MGPPSLRPFQIQATESLLEGQSVLIHAPTGLGKTWATANPFFAGTDTLANVRLLHVLPMRALANSVCDDIRKLQEVSGSTKQVAPVIHHGQQQESHVFAEQACVTTIDQYFAGFAGAPLSFSSRSGHAVAGAIMSSYSVFDEVHLLEPEAGLPMLYAVLKQRQKWNLPSAVMTATLPRKLRQFLSEQVGLKIIDLSEDDIQARDGWRKVHLHYHDTAWSGSEAAKQIVKAQEQHGKVIAFANTVEASIDLYRSIKSLNPQAALHLVHSNFAPTERKAREDAIRKAFAEGAEGAAILVTTQVCEAGINISAPVVFSELAPVDSLIQRAGRCSRFKSQPEGVFHVYPAATHDDRKNRHAPYNEDLVTRTEVAFQNRAGHFLLDWPTECDLVDEVLDDYYSHFVRGERVSRKDAEIKKAKKGQITSLPDVKPKTRGLTINDALGLFDQAFHMRSGSTVEQVLREINNVQVMVVKEGLSSAVIASTSEKATGMFQEDYLNKQNALRFGQRDALETIPVSLGRFMRHGARLNVFELTLQPQEHDAPIYSLNPTAKFLPNHTYVISLEEAGYSAEYGLTFDPEIEHPITTQRITPGAYDLQSREHHFQTWFEHCLKVYQQSSRILEKYIPFIQQISRSIPEKSDDFADLVVSLIRVASLFHDIGKLSMDWQKAIGWTETAGPFWGKSQQDVAVQKLPPHAYHAIPVLRYLFGKLGVTDDAGNVDRLAELIALASARHHSLGALDGRMAWEKFTPHADPERTLSAIRELVQAALGEDAEQILPFVNQEMLDSIHSAEYLSNDEYAFIRDTPSPSEDYYPFYVLASRIIKVGDWEASGEKEIELCR